MKDDTISRAAALSALNGLTEIYLNNLPPTIYKSDAVDAIKELPSAQPTGTNTVQVEDCISRAAVLNLIEQSCCDLEYDSDNVALRKEVEALPSAQPERKKGKWIERNPQNSPDCRLIECSECGNAYIVGYNINYDDWIDGRNFCMKCGADLRGGSNDKNT